MPGPKKRQAQQPKFKKINNLTLERFPNNLEEISNLVSEFKEGYKLINDVCLGENIKFIKNPAGIELDQDFIRNLDKFISNFVPLKETIEELNTLAATSPEILENKELSNISYTLHRDPYPNAHQKYPLYGKYLEVYENLTKDYNNLYSTIFGRKAKKNATEDGIYKSDGDIKDLSSQKIALGLLKLASKQLESKEQPDQMDIDKAFQYINMYLSSRRITSIPNSDQQEDKKQLLTTYEQEMDMLSRLAHYLSNYQEQIHRKYEDTLMKIEAVEDDDNIAFNRQSMNSFFADRNMRLQEVLIPAILSEDSLGSSNEFTSLQNKLANMQNKSVSELSSDNGLSLITETLEAANKYITHAESKGFWHLKFSNTASRRLKAVRELSSILDNFYKQSKYRNQLVELVNEGEKWRNIEKNISNINRHFGKYVDNIKQSTWYKKKIKNANKNTNTQVDNQININKQVHTSAMRERGNH